MKNIRDIDYKLEEIELDLHKTFRSVGVLTNKLEKYFKAHFRHGWQ